MPISKKGLTHTVFFWMHNPNNPQERAALQAGIEKLATIHLIKEAFIGCPANTNRDVIDSSYDFSISFLFENAQDQDAYQTIPEHLAFVENCAHLWKKVQVYDAISY